MVFRDDREDTFLFFLAHLYLPSNVAMVKHSVESVEIQSFF